MITDDQMHEEIEALYPGFSSFLNMQITNLAKLTVDFDNALIHFNAPKAMEIKEQIESILSITKLPIINRKIINELHDLFKSPLNRIALLFRFVIRDEIKVEHRERDINNILGEGELIDIDDVLGRYYPAEQLIVLYDDAIATCANILGNGITAEMVETVVYRHEAAHAVIHLGLDANNNNFSLDRFNSVDDGKCPGKLHETWAQLLCYYSVKDDDKLYRCFKELSNRSSFQYQLWLDFTEIDIERVRNVTIDIRTGKLSAKFESFSRYVL